MSKVFTPAELERMARIGQLGMLTGDKVLAPMGEVNLKRSQGLHELELDRQQKQAIRDEEARKLAAYQQNWERGDAFARERLAADLSENEKDRALKRELERMGLAADAAAVTSDGLEAGSSAEQKAREADRLAAEAARLKGTMPSGAVHRGKDLVVDIASGVRPVFGQLVGSAMYDKDQNKWRADANRFDQDVSNLAAGLAITGFELENKQKWSPQAPGISEEEAKDRWDNIQQTFKGRASAVRGGYSPPTAGPRNRRTVGGKSYVQVGPDEWEEE
jgi:hypothetical protein